MPDIEFIEGEIERMRSQVLRERNEITQLQRAGISTTSAEALLGRMLKRTTELPRDDILWRGRRNRCAI